MSTVVVTPDVEIIRTRWSENGMPVHTFSSRHPFTLELSYANWASVDKLESLPVQQDTLHVFALMVWMDMIVRVMVGGQCVMTLYGEIAQRYQQREQVA